MATIEPNKYIEFVRQTTSPASSNYVQLLSRLSELEAQDADVPRLLTAAFGMSAEAGEFTEIVKKMFLQGKPYNDDNVEHLKIELGDILWYAAQACMALDVSFEDVMERNYLKLSARYPEGAFDVYRSENRKEGDL
jgi:NTP pyrophosphatase (non-canonical NTP hydrolase)